jgi:hypothetical protein
VPVGVVRAHGDERGAGAGGREEPGIGVRAAVVRNLEHVGPQIDPAGAQPGLGLRPEVSGQEDPHAPDGGAHDQRQVVGLRDRRGPLRLGGEDLQDHSARLSPVPGHQPDAFAPRPPDQGVDGRYPVVGRGECAGRHRPDRSTVERPGQAAHVVGVQVGQEHQRKPLDPQCREAAVDRRDVGAGVHEHRLPRRTRGQHQRVALPHVAGDDHGVGQRPAPHDLAHRPADQHQPGQCRDGERAEPPEAPQRPARHRQEDRQEDRAHQTRGPTRRRVGELRRALGDQDQPAGRPACAPDQDVAGRRGHRPHHRGQETEHRRGRHRRCGEQIGRQRDEADRSRERRDQWRRRQPGGRTDREGVRHQRRPAAFPQPA